MNLIAYIHHISGSFLFLPMLYSYGIRGNPFQDGIPDIVYGVLVSAGAFVFSKGCGIIFLLNKKTSMNDEEEEYLGESVPPVKVEEGEEAN